MEEYERELNKLKEVHVQKLSEIGMGAGAYDECVQRLNRIQDSHISSSGFQSIRAASPESRGSAKALNFKPTNQEIIVNTDYPEVGDRLLPSNPQPHGLP